MKLSKNAGPLLILGAVAVQLIAKGLSVDPVDPTDLDKFNPSEFWSWVSLALTLLIVSVYLFVKRQRDRR